MQSRPLLSSRALHQAPVERTDTDPENTKRKAWLADKFGGLFSDPRFARLRTSLTAHGGWDLIPDPSDPQLDYLLSDRAQVWDGRGARWTVGESNRCHGNVAWRFLKTWPRYLLGTGYALSPDGVWIGHSWLLEHTRGQPTRIVETTVGRLLYAGVILDPGGAPNPIGPGFLPGGIESMRFALGNLDSLDDAPPITDVVDMVINKDPRFLAIVAACSGGMVDADKVRATIRSRKSKVQEDPKTEVEA